MIDTGEFDEDRWQLFHTDVDRSEAHDLAAEHPEKVRELSELWLTEAKKNVLPLNDYGVEGIHSLEYRVAPPEDGRYTYYPDKSEIPEAAPGMSSDGSVAWKQPFAGHVRSFRRSEAGLFAQRQGRPRNKLTSAVTRPIQRAPGRCGRRSPTRDPSPWSRATRLRRRQTRTASAARWLGGTLGAHALPGTGSSRLAQAADRTVSNVV